MTDMFDFLKNRRTYFLRDIRFPEDCWKNMTNPHFPLMAQIKAGMGFTAECRNSDRIHYLVTLANYGHVSASKCPIGVSTRNSHRRYAYPDISSTHV